MPIVGNVIGGVSGAPKSIILQTEDGEEMIAVLTGSEVVFTAGPNDIREGKVAANANGVVTGNKVIPAYHTNQGIQVIPAGSSCSITGLTQLDAYEYTKIQAIICDFNTTIDDSVSASKVVINDNVYAVQTVVSLSTLSKNHDDKSVDLGVVNDTGAIQLVRFFTYKEIE